MVLTGRDSHRLSMFSNSIRTLNASASGAETAYSAVAVGHASYNGAEGVKANPAKMFQEAEENLLASTK